MVVVDDFGLGREVIGHGTLSSEVWGRQPAASSAEIAAGCGAGWL
jgi:hypothetical protein